MQRAIATARSTAEKATPEWQKAVDSQLTVKIFPLVQKRFTSEILFCLVAPHQSQHTLEALNSHCSFAIAAFSHVPKTLKTRIFILYSEMAQSDMGCHRRREGAIAPSRRVKSTENDKTLCERGF